ncbi:MAG TPA: 4Fe-4S dicluster domain-containing protein [bacterium]|nr:4Fe-4S dicluster domain-containing protein [bacterium]
MARSTPVSRRNFIGQTAAGLGLLGLGATRANSRDEAPEKKIITRTLGRTGLELPVVSMGVMNANVSDLVMESYRLGVRHFDTAWGYQGGNNERMLGRSIRQLGVRKEVVIATKFPAGNLSGDNIEETMRVIRQRFEESLRRLDTDHVDILYFHGANDPSQVRSPEIRDLLSEFKKEGKMRFSGISCHSNTTAVVNAMTESGSWDVALITLNFAMADDTTYIRALRGAADKGIGLIAMKTQAGGDWWRNARQKSTRFDGPLNQSAMLKWVLNNPFITTAVPGYTTFDQLREDIAVAYDLSYTEEEEKFLGDREIQMGLGFCRQCGSCTARCPKHVDIPTLMRSHMYAFQYHNLEQAHAAIREIAPRYGLAECLDCAVCSAACVRSVAVPERIRELKQLAAYRWS